MADDPATIPTPPEAIQAPTPPAATPPPAPTLPVAAVVVVPEEPKSEGKVIPVPTADFKKIKDEARDRGRREAQAEADAAAVQAGFASYAEALAYAISNKTKPTPTVTTTKPPEIQTMAKPTTKPAPVVDKAAQRAEASRETDRQRRRAAERTLRATRADLAAKEAEIELVRELHGHGVQDTDYMSRLIVRELQGKTPEEIAKFDRAAFVAKQRTEKPYLFGEVTKPATTGTGAAPTSAANGAPATPAAGAAAAAAADAKRFDAKTATDEQIRDRYRQLGLTAPQ